MCTFDTTREHPRAPASTREHPRAPASTREHPLVTSRTRTGPPYVFLDTAVVFPRSFEMSHCCGIAVMF